MLDGSTTEQPPLTRDEAIEQLRRIRADFAEAMKDLTADEYEALVESLTHQVNEGLRRHVRESRGDAV